MEVCSDGFASIFRGSTDAPENQSTVIASRPLMKDTEHSHREISHRSPVPVPVRNRPSPSLPWRTSRGSAGPSIETVISNIKCLPDGLL